MVRQAIQRARLAGNNSDIPVELPAAWVKLGNLDRAEAIADAIPDDPGSAKLDADEFMPPRWFPDRERRDKALRAVAAAMSEAGHHDRAAAVFSRVKAKDENPVSTAPLVTEAEARAITSPAERSAAFVALVRSHAANRSHDRIEAMLDHAEAAARAIKDSPQSQAKALVPVVAAAAEAGYFRSADAITQSLTYPGAQTKALAATAIALAAFGDHRRAVETLYRAEATAFAVAQRVEHVRGLVAAAIALTTTGDHQRVREALHLAETTARAITDSYQQTRTLISVAIALNAAGRPERAEAVLRSIADPALRDVALAALAAELAKSGDPETAEAMARALALPWGDKARVSIATAFAETGQIDRAETVANLAKRPDLQKEALLPVIKAFAAAGQHDRAQRIAESFDRKDWRGSAIREVTAGLVVGGDYERAATIAEAIDTEQQVKVLTATALALISAGDRQRTDETLAKAEALATAGTEPYSRALWLISVAGALAMAGHHERANNAFQQAEADLDTLESLRSWTVGTLVKALADAGHHEWAARVADTISLPKSRAWAQRAAARGGSRAHQVQAVANALKIEDWTDVVPDLVHVVPEAAHAIYTELTR